MENALKMGYSKIARFFHWFIAAIVLVMLSASFFIDDLPKQYSGSAFMIHKSFGLTLLFLMLIRLIWIYRNEKPALPLAMPKWEKHLARFVQYGLYFFIILMALCGWLMSAAANKTPTFFGLFQVAFPGIGPNKALAQIMSQAHKTIAWIIIALLVLHIVGALKHHFIDKDDILRRMLRKS